MEVHQEKELDENVSAYNNLYDKPLTCPRTCHKDPIHLVIK